MQGRLVTDKALTDKINTDAEMMQRKCRRVIEVHGLKAELGGGRGAAAELYWAAVAVLGEAGEVEAELSDAARRTRRKSVPTTGARTPRATASGF